MVGNDCMIILGDKWYKGVGLYYWIKLSGKITP